MRSIALLLCNLIPMFVAAQFEISFQLGYGVYSLSEIHDLQQEIKSSFPVEPRITEDFPPYFLYSVSGKQTLNNKTLLGLTLSYGSTGGRISYNDYSGSITAEQLLAFYSIDLAFGPYWQLPHRFICIIDVKPGLTITSLELKGEQYIQPAPLVTESNKFVSANLTLQPTIHLSKSLGQFGISLHVGYQVAVLEGELKYSENKEYYLTNNQGNAVHAQWDGLRIGVGLSYFIEGKKK